MKSTFAPFRIRSYRFQWPADLLTSWALEMEFLILGWYVLVETGSVVLLTLFGALQHGGTLIAPILGVISDRIGPRNLLTGMRMIYAAIATTLMTFAFAGALNPMIVLVLVFLMGLVRPSDLGLRAALIADTMPPEQLPKFWEAIRSGKGEFVNGSRLVYPMEDQAMRFLNLVANKSFSLLFTWLLSQRFTDTLCGTKAMLRSDYARLKAGRSYFGDFDPFGDFDLIFGASKLGLKAVEIPIRYASRTYGETQISRFRHGFMLLRMVLFAFTRIKAM